MLLKHVGGGEPHFIQCLVKIIHDMVKKKQMETFISIIAEHAMNLFQFPKEKYIKL